MRGFDSISRAEMGLRVMDTLEGLDTSHIPLDRPTVELLCRAYVFGVHSITGGDMHPSVAAANIQFSKEMFMEFLEIYVAHLK